jgi:hypothetical protein
MWSIRCPLAALRDRKFADSLLEGAGFEPPVPLAKRAERRLGIPQSRSPPSGFCEGEADTGFASGKAENMIA